MTSSHSKINLPGDHPPNEEIKRMIRVNHAGEFGATRIYAGQIAVLGETAQGDTLRHMQEQEVEHYNYFDQQITKRAVRPTLFSPFWHMAGFALGAATAMMGKKAAMACTVAVEETIDEHYQEQIEQLDQYPNEQELKEHIIRFREEELEHRDIGLENEAEQAPAYNLLYQTIRKGSKLAIWLSTRL